MKKRFALGLAAGLGAAMMAARLSRARLGISFEDRVVVITGGSRGLGLVLARLFVDEGARVAILARNMDDLERARLELEARGRGAVMTLRCDVRRRRDVRAAVDAVIERWRSIDVLVNNAGILQAGPLETMAQEDFANAMATHFWGPLHLILETAPVMRHRGFGRIVNTRRSPGGGRAAPRPVQRE
jgi:NAD(P)-dependent dehydrogenase (short-subunit alcohol dehydrogenase family)